jgi:hypothetical protein
VSTATEPADALLEKLADIARSIEAHGAAIWQLEHEREGLRLQLRRSGWRPPQPVAETPVASA